MTRRLVVIPVLAALALLDCSKASTQGPRDGNDPTMALTVVASGLTHPLWLTAPPGDPRLFIVEQPGRIRIVRDGQLLPRPFLDLTDRVLDGGERGLLSVAFHPRYRDNGFLYVNYTDVNGDTRVERYHVTGDPDVADPGSGHLVLFVKQPYANHNGGLVLFGPDGKLYVGMGDGGGGGDPHGNGQNRAALLGKLLRLDVDAGDPYSVPTDNPFVGVRGARPEIWALGLRNPWRFCFDREASLLYIADVGQNHWEEIDVAPAGRGGLNYGWNVMEGNHCYRAPLCDRDGLQLPVLEYSHREGCSVTGGFVYRGSDLPELRGHYVYGDYCSGWVRSFRVQGGAAVDARRWNLGDVGQIMSFGEDARRELYLLSDNGRAYRFTRRTGPGRTR